LRMATLEQLAEVSGFGGKAAEELKRFLEARREQPAPIAEEAFPAETLPPEEDALTN